MTQRVSKKNFLIYQEYNKGLPADAVAKLFSCTVDDVYKAIVLHAVEVDRGVSCKDHLLSLIENGFPIETIASYYEMSEAELRMYLYSDSVGQAS